MNEIKTIPFDALYIDTKSTQTTQLDAQLSALIKIRQRQYKQGIERLLAVASASDSEAGIEGIEEGYEEQYGSFNPQDVTLPDNIIKETNETVASTAHKAFCDAHSISSKLEWLPHQLLATFGNWKAVKNESGKYDALETLRANAMDDWSIGLVYFATGPRANIFNKAPRHHPQYTSSINPLVPIILAGFKKNQNIGYDEWQREPGLRKMLDVSLADAMACSIPELTKTELIALRNKALTDMSGPRMGRPQSPITCAKLNHLGDTALGALPRLAKYMALQTWCAHPSNRTKYMILDPKLWDSMPEPIVEASVLVESSGAKWSSDTPW